MKLQQLIGQKVEMILQRGMSRAFVEGILKYDEEWVTYYIIDEHTEFITLAAFDEKDITEIGPSLRVGAKAVICIGTPV